MTALESRELNSQHERELTRSEGSGMLIGNPHGEGSNASSTNKESNLTGRQKEQRHPSNPPPPTHTHTHTHPLKTYLTRASGKSVIKPNQ